MVTPKSSLVASPSIIGWGKREVRLAAALVAAAVLLAYANCFRVPILLDDEPAISTNASIRDLSAIGQVLTPPPNIGPSGRPLLNLTFAINYAIGGEQVFSYHLFNVGVHLAVALLLLGIVRRLLGTAPLAARFGRQSDPLALAIALLWAVHPLLTETVTYISQRAEALMAFFYLATLYGLLRSIESRGASRRWLVLSAVACWLGMTTKEAMATAPFVVFVFDWIFLSESAYATLRARGRYYAALAASWLLLGGLMTLQGQHTVGFEKGITAWTYLLTECLALGHYLKSAVWPHPLLFDFGPVFAHRLGQVWPQALLIVALLGLTVGLLFRKPWLGFAGVWFFVILSPTSSFIPVALQPMAESRMYLPLIAIVTVAVLLTYCYIGRAVFGATLAISLIGIGLSYARNRDYASDLVLWVDTVAKAPLNSRAHNNLGILYAKAGKLDTAVTEYRRAIELTPTTPTMHYNLAKVYVAQGAQAAGIAQYREALRLNPAYSDAKIALATALAGGGHEEEALQQLQEAVALKPDDFQAHYNLGLNLYRAGKVDPAMTEFRRSLALSPNAVEPRNALATAFVQAGRPTEAASEYVTVLRIDPTSAEAHTNLGNLLLASDHTAEAKAHFEAALRTKPDSAGAQTGLGLAEMASGEAQEAQRHFFEAVRLDPSDAEAHFRLGNLSAMAGDLTVAAAQWETSLRLRPNDAEAHNNLATAYAQMGRADEAIREYREALRLKPDYQRAQANLDDLLTRRP